MGEKFDMREVRREIAEDEKVMKTKPVLLSQQEIQNMIEKRDGLTAEGKGHAHV